MCLENRIAHWKEAVDLEDAIILHNPLKGTEESMLNYVGENVLC